MLPPTIDECCDMMFLSLLVVVSVYLSVSVVYCQFASGARSMAHVKESAVETELRQRVRARGGICEKTTVIGRRGLFGRVVVLPGGRVVFCELKRPAVGRLSPHQILRVAQYKALDAEVRVIRTSEDIDRLLSPG